MIGPALGQGVNNVPDNARDLEQKQINGKKREKTKDKTAAMAGKNGPDQGQARKKTGVSLHRHPVFTRSHLPA